VCEQMDIVAVDAFAVLLLSLFILYS
jgi:hypothetical protein